MGLNNLVPFFMEYTMSKPITLMQALMNMHAEFGVILGKDKKGNRGTYTSLPGVLSQIHNMTKKHGLLLFQRPDFEIDSGVQSLMTRLEHVESGENIWCRSLLTPTPNAPSADQAYGSSMTYHRRYDAMALCGLFCDEDPADHDGWKDHELSQPTPDIESTYIPRKAGVISEKQVKLLAWKLKEQGKNELKDALILKFGSLDDVTIEAFNKLKPELGLN